MNYNKKRTVSYSTLYGTVLFRLFLHTLQFMQSIEQLFSNLLRTITFLLQFSLRLHYNGIQLIENSPLAKSPFHAIAALSFLERV